MTGTISYMGYLITIYCRGFNYGYIIQEGTNTLFTDFGYSQHGALSKAKKVIRSL